MPPADAINGVPTDRLYRMFVVLRQPPVFWLITESCGIPPHQSRFARQLPPRGKPSFLAFPLRQLRKTLFSQALPRKETLFYRVFRSNVCGKVRFFEVPLRGRWTAAGGTDEVPIPQENVKNQKGGDIFPPKPRYLSRWSISAVAMLMP